MRVQTVALCHPPEDSPSGAKKGSAHRVAGIEKPPRTGLAAICSLRRDKATTPFTGRNPTAIGAPCQAIGGSGQAASCRGSYTGRKLESATIGPRNHMTSPRIVSAIFVVLAVMSPTLAHASDRMFIPVPSEGQSVNYDRGEITLLTSNQSASLGIVFVPRDKKSGYVQVAVENIGSQSFTIGDTSVTAAANGVPLQVLTYADRVKKEDRKEMWGRVAVALEAGANSMAASNAGYATQSGTYSSRTTASAYGSGGSAYGSASTHGSYSGTTYNPAVAQLARANAAAQNELMIERSRANAASARQELGDRALRLTTLVPARWIVGDVQLVLPKRVKGSPTEFVVTIDVAGDPVSVLYRESVSE